MKHRTVPAGRGSGAAVMAAGVALALALSASEAGGQAQPADPFAEAATGTLWLDLELSGSGRRNIPNGVEWASLQATRKMSVRVRMRDMGNRNVPIVAGKERAEGTAPAGMEAIEAAAAACKGDQACLIATMMKYGSQLKPEAYGLKLDSKRFRNWAGDRRTACASGALWVRDRGEGVIISPPSPAAAYRFERAGSADPQKQAGRLSEALCAAELTYDAETATASLRLQLGGLNVPVTLTGHAFTHEKSVPLVEGRNMLELFDQPVPPGAEAGSVELKELGSASHNSGQVTAPLGGRLSWRFLPD